MAAPTDLRVESNSITTNVLNWTYGGSANIAIYRALHGGAFSELTDPTTRIAASVKTYIDSMAVAGTFYDYKVSDDAGSTFSLVVSVVTQVCPSATGSTQSTSAPGLPQFVSETDVNAQALQQLSQQVEATLATQVTNPQDCQACPVNGAVVINCNDSCFNFTVVLTEDVNSISINQCNTGNINFVVPPNTTRKVCGFPSGFGFTGDECFNAPLVAGAAGRTVAVGMGNGAAKLASSKLGYGGGGGGGGGGGAGCSCTPDKPNLLTIKSCNTNNSLNCLSTKELQLLACGGSPPYSWSKTGSIALSRATGTSTTVTPVANAGSAVAGNAYTKQAQFCDGGVIGPLPAANTYGCNDQLTIASGCGGSFVCAGVGSVLFGVNNPGCEAYPAGSTPVYCQKQDGTCDVRSGSQIAAGCVPCGIASIGATVTVTDSIGTSVTIILNS